MPGGERNNFYMKVFQKLLKRIYSGYALMVFIVTLLLIFPFTLIAGLFGNIRGGNMIIRLCMIWADCWFALIFIRHKKIYDSPGARQSAGPGNTKPGIFVSKHISKLDAAILMKAIRRPFRALGKSDKRKIPVYGFIYSHAIVSVDPNSFSNRVGSVRLLKSLIQKGISIMVFPEGTFNFSTTPLEEFHDGPFWLAIETQTPVRPFLLPDAYRRMPFGNFFSMSPGLNRIVYLDEIPVAGYTLSDVARLKDEVYSIMEKKLIAYDAAWRKIVPSKSL